MINTDNIILDGKVVAKKIEEKISEEINKLVTENKKRPLLTTILVGDDKGSVMYVKMKAKACSRVGIENNLLRLPSSTTTEELLDIIDSLNNNSDVSGILIQHPLPKNIDEQKCFDAIALEKDVDGVNSNSFGKMVMKSDAFGAATPQAIISILDYYNISIEGQHAVVIGRSPILGKPVSMMLLNRNATVTICHTKTKNIADIVKTADIVVAACGKPEFVKKEWLKEGVVLLDAGYNAGNIGDISKDAYEVSSAYTPVPGGVGPVTIAKVLENTLLAEKKKIEKPKEKILI